MTTEFRAWPNLGWLTADLPPDLVALAEEACRAFDQLAPLQGWSVASADRRSYLPPPALEQWIVSLAEGYCDHVEQASTIRIYGSRLRITDCWINRLTPGESTPRHTHDSLISWTIWPWNSEPLIFDWTTTTGWPQSTLVPARGGQICLFPSRLAHRVEAVTTTRWSMSGNCKIA